MMNVLDRLKQSGVVPVVVLDNAKDAAPTAKALLASSVDVMEITFRTAAAADSIKAVSGKLPGHASRRRHGHHARPVPQGRRVRREVHRCPRL